MSQIHNSIAIHEASHAVAGLCFGRFGLLKLVSIVETESMKGGCHWVIDIGKCPPKERNRELAINFAGPIGEVLYAPDSFGGHLQAFKTTILQPNHILDEAGCAGWGSTDFNRWLLFRRS